MNGIRAGALPCRAAVEIGKSADVPVLRDFSESLTPCSKESADQLTAAELEQTYLPGFNMLPNR